MARRLTASDRASLIRLASSMPVGSPQRKAVLSSLGKTPSHRKVAGTSPFSRFVQQFLWSLQEGWWDEEEGIQRLALTFEVDRSGGITINAGHSPGDVGEEGLEEIKPKLEKFFGCKFTLDYTTDGYSYFHQASVLGRTF